MAKELPPQQSPASLADSQGSGNSPIDSHRDPFEELASEFAERQRMGEYPSVEEYAAAHPDLAEEIRDLFPTIAAMEQLKQRKASTPQPTLGGLPLEELGDFRILGEIGRGGMGVVYEAEQVSLGRRVAVKVLPQQALLDERHLRRFEREAQTAAKLHHTNIVPVFGVGQQDGYHYIVMQFIPGVGLDEVLLALRALVLETDSPQFAVDSSSRASHANHNARALIEGNFGRQLTGGGFAASFHKDDHLGSHGVGSQDEDCAAVTVAMDPTEVSHATEPEPRPADTTRLDTDTSQQLSTLAPEFYQSIARIGYQTADALAYAHEQGTLHRDIKPGNLLLDSTGTVWVADFGLAKLTEHDNVSRTGDIVGTLSYMPPESFSGETDGRGDTYSLGLTLFEMLTLRPAFYGRDRGMVVKQITEGDLPRLGKLNPCIPRDLQTIVLKAIAHRPEDRYATARDFAEDLQRYLDDLPILARRMSVPEQFVRWCRKNKLVASLAASVLTLLITTAGLVTYNAEQRAKKQTEIAEIQTDLSEKAKETASLALGALMTIFDGLAPNRLPLSADESLQVSEVTTAENLEAEEVAATVAPPPITEQTAASLAVFLDTFDRLAQRAGNDSELALNFAELTLRVGKLHKMLGKQQEALQAFDQAISKFNAAMDKNPKTAIVGLAMSYNEKGDVLAPTDRRASYESYRRAFDLLKDNETLLADSHRAQYEKARTLFLLSVERSGFGRGGPPGRRGRGEPRGGLTNLQQAIAILKKLTQQDPDPEYVYLLARCHHGLSIAALPFAPAREINIREAISLLRRLVDAHPEVADYKFEYAITLLRSLEQRDVETKAQVITDVVQLVEEIASQNPGVWDYAKLQAMAMARRAQILDQQADRLAKDNDPREAELRVETVRVANRSADILDQLRTRFPNQFASVSARFRGLADFDFLRATVTAKANQHEQAVRLFREILQAETEEGTERWQGRRTQQARIELAKSLKQIGNQEEADAILTQLQVEFKPILEKEIQQVEGPGWGRNRFEEVLELYARVEAELNGVERAKEFLQSVRSDRVAVIEERALSKEASILEIARFNLQAARCLRKIGAASEAEELLTELLTQLETLDTAIDFETLRQASAEERRRIGMQRFGMRGLFFDVLEELGDEEALSKERARTAPELHRVRQLIFRGRNNESGRRGPGGRSRRERPEG